MTRLIVFTHVLIIQRRVLEISIKIKNSDFKTAVLIASNEIENADV